MSHTETAAREPVRQPSVAGRFYPDQPDQLVALLKRFFEEGRQNAAQSPTACDGRYPLGVMLPHAGYIFSGAVAGLTLAHTTLLDDKSGRQPDPDETFILLGPSHTGRGVPLAVWPGGTWRTPLGDMRVDEAFAAELIADQNSTFEANQSGHLGDHTLEVLVPFLRFINPQAAIVPITVSLYNPAGLRRAGGTLASLMAKRKNADKKICIVASSDMSHFLPHEQNMRQDALALEQIRNLAPEGLFKTVTNHGISMCGFAAVTLMLAACLELGAKECCVTAHTSSGITGRQYGADMERVVGYAGAVIPKPLGPEPPQK